MGSVRRSTRARGRRSWAAPGSGTVWREAPGSGTAWREAVAIGEAGSWVASGTAVLRNDGGRQSVLGGSGVEEVDAAARTRSTAAGRRSGEEDVRRPWSVRPNLQGRRRRLRWGRGGGGCRWNGRGGRSWGLGGEEAGGGGLGHGGHGLGEEAGGGGGPGRGGGGGSERVRVWESERQRRRWIRTRGWGLTK